MSGWRLQTPVDSFSFPTRSFIASRSTLRITNDILMLEGMQKLELIDVEGNPVTAYPGSEEVIPDSFFEKSATSRSETISAITLTNGPEENLIQADNRNLATAGLSTGPSNSEQTALWIWISGLIAIIVVAATVLFLFPKKSKNKIDVLSADDIEILE